jgi:hypothetical protein
MKGGDLARRGENCDHGDDSVAIFVPHIGAESELTNSAKSDMFDWASLFAENRCPLFGAML